MPSVTCAAASLSSLALTALCRLQPETHCSPLAQAITAKPSWAPSPAHGLGSTSRAVLEGRNLTAHSTVLCLSWEVVAVEINVKDSLLLSEGKKKKKA